MSNPTAMGEPQQNRPLILRALAGEKTERTPVWLMRQAGRSDPEYRALRAGLDLPLEDLFSNPELSTQISLLPARIGVDAIIFFQDILTPLGPMGARFVFRPGPQLERPFHSARELERLDVYDPASELPFVGQTLGNLRGQLSPGQALLGFAGAPLTLLFFVLAGGSPKTVAENRAFLKDNPNLAHTVLEKIATMTVEYLRYQFASGAQAVQLFESLAHQVTRGEYEEFALPYQQKIMDEIRIAGPAILFARGFGEMDLLKQAGATALSIGVPVPLDEVRQEVGTALGLQGNVSNQVLATGTKAEVRSAALECLQRGKCHGHVLNLDHGVLPKTPWGNVEEMVKTAHEFRAED